MATINSWTNQFSYDPMRQVAGYLVTQNCESQTLAIDGSNAENIQTTGTKAVIINGTPVKLAADAEYDISAELPYAAWAASTSYTTAGAVSEVTHVEGAGTIHYVCIEAHTSAAADEPNVGANWETYWKRLDAYATAAVGLVVADGTTRDFLVCALSDGTLRMFKAYDSDGTFQIPAYDPTRYVAIGYIEVAASGADYTCGTTALTTIGTFVDLTGPVLPDVDVVGRLRR